MITQGMAAGTIVHHPARRSLRCLAAVLAWGLAGCSSLPLVRIQATGPSPDQGSVIRDGETVPVSQARFLLRGEALRTRSRPELLLVREEYQMVVGPWSEVAVLNPSIDLRKGVAFIRRVARRIREGLTVHARGNVVQDDLTEYLIIVDDSTTLVAVVSGRVGVAVPGMPDTVYVPALSQLILPSDRPVPIPLQPETQRLIRSLMPVAEGGGELAPWPAVDLVVVPDVIGRPVPEALAQLEAGRLGSGHLQSADGRLGSLVVTRQEPAAGTQAPAGTPVHLFFPAPKPPASGFFGEWVLQFAPGQSALLPSGQAALDRIGPLLTANPHWTVVVQGHADSQGPDAFNASLSAARAATVADYLERRHRIGRERIQAQSFGERQPRERNDSRTGRAINRRVELRVLIPAQR